MCCHHSLTERQKRERKHGRHLQALTYVNHTHQRQLGGAAWIGAADTRACMPAYLLRLKKGQMPRHSLLSYNKLLRQGLVQGKPGRRPPDIGYHHGRHGGLRWLCVRKRGRTRSGRRAERVTDCVACFLCSGAVEFYFLRCQDGVTRPTICFVFSYFHPFWESPKLLLCEPNTNSDRTP